MSNKDWDPNLTPEQNYVLKQEGTESPGSSPLNQEKREGSYHCVGCGTKLFESSTKYESGSGWPSFFESVQGVFEEKRDMHIGYPSCLLYTSPSPRDGLLSRMPSSA